MGATVDPWIDARRLSKALGRSERGFARWFHGYVSGDPSVRVEGTPMPVAAPATDYPTVSLHAVLVAAAMALRVPITDVRRTRSPARRLFLLLARRQGWRDVRQLARVAGMSRRAVLDQLARTEPGDPAALDAAALCLGDARLGGLTILGVGRSGGLAQVGDRC
jgi:hypothetical protein